VTAFHLIEHLPHDVLIALLTETARVLQAGGVAIFETPNPQNVRVGSNTFYLDPTHRHPLPPPLTQFLAEARGLRRVEIMPLHPCDENLRVHGSEVADRFNQYWYGPQDYGVIGWKV
jgi:O-antigen chain-terminating methyltransferase